MTYETRNHLCFSELGVSAAQQDREWKTGHAIANAWSNLYAWVEGRRTWLRQEAFGEEELGVEEWLQVAHGCEEVLAEQRAAARAGCLSVLVPHDFCTHVLRMHPEIHHQLVNLTPENMMCVLGKIGHDRPAQV